MNDQEQNAAAALVTLALPLPTDPGVRAHFAEIIESERQRAHLMALFARGQIEQSKSIVPDLPDARANPEWRFVFGPNSTHGWCRAHHLPLAPVPKI